MEHKNVDAKIAYYQTMLNRAKAEKEAECNKNTIETSPFFLITVTGEHGCKYRHKKFDAAVKEATRLAKLTNHDAHIMGVVAIAKPLPSEVEVEIEIQ